MTLNNILNIQCILNIYSKYIFINVYTFVSNNTHFKKDII